ncbi:carbon monoxide dehydrogenase subunit G [Mumia flava]|uniref:Carbon monoxide dehydrogenase subunit G n=1 Tax=Mumia flava TaxID=1348852 RepID=A0A0B2B6E3_9ACTN|nr:SRPBCC family protein [Mumia flava]PJJ53961.1 carbon monoxide dehydrogenase subunit G [Mumia flava]
MVAHVLSLSQDVAAPPERVWEVLTDLPGTAAVLTGVTRIEVLTDGPYAVGTRWRETRRVFGREETQEMWVGAVDPPRSTVVRARAGGIDYDTTFTLEPSGAGTALTMEFRGEDTSTSRLKRLVETLTAPLGRSVTRKIMRRDLEDIAAAAEGRPSENAGS